MNHYTPTQWVTGLIQLSLYIALGGWLARGAFFPKPEDNLKRHQRVIRGIGAVLFGVGILLAIPFWLGMLGNSK